MAEGKEEDLSKLTRRKLAIIRLGWRQHHSCLDRPQPPTARVVFLPLGIFFHILSTEAILSNHPRSGLGGGAGI